MKPKEKWARIVIYSNWTYSRILNIRWMTYAWSRMFSYISFPLHSKHSVFITKSNQCMFYSDSLCYCKNYEQNEDVLNVKASGTYSYHCTLNGLPPLSNWQHNITQYTYHGKRKVIRQTHTDDLEQGWPLCSPRRKYWGPPYVQFNIHAVSLQNIMWQIY